MGGVLGLLVLGPLALALAVLLLPAPWWRRAAVGGAFLLAALGLAAARVAAREGPGLRGAWEADGGLLDQALGRAGIDDPVAHGALRASLLAGSEEQGRAALERAAGQPEALAWARDVQRYHPGDQGKLLEAEAALRQAEARVEALLLQRRALAVDLTTLRLAVASPRGAELRLVACVPWVPALGLQWFLAVDPLGGFLLLAVGLVGLAAAAGLPEGPEGRAPAATCLALQGALAGAIAAQDAALVWGFLLLLPFPGWLLLLGDDAAGRAATAERWALLALGSLLPFGAALGGAAAAHGAQPVFALPVLAGGVPEALQGGLLAGALLLALPRLLPLPGAADLAAQLARAPGPARALVQLAWVGAGVWGLLLIVPLAPAALGGAGTGRTLLGALGLGGLFLAAGRALAAAPGTGLVAALVQARAGLAALGLACGGEAGLLGAGLSLLSLAAAGGAAQLAVAGLERGGGDLAQLLSRRPLLARTAGLALLLLGGLPGSGGFVAGLLVLEGARRACPFAVTLAVAVGLALLGWAALRGVSRAVRELRAGAPSARAVADLTAVEAHGILPLLVLELVTGMLPALFLDPLLPVATRLAGELGR